MTVIGWRPNKPSTCLWNSMQLPRNEKDSYIQICNHPKNMSEKWSMCTYMHVYKDRERKEMKDEWEVLAFATLQGQVGNKWDILPFAPNSS